MRGVAHHHAQVLLSQARLVWTDDETVEETGELRKIQLVRPENSESYVSKDTRTWRVTEGYRSSPRRHGQKEGSEELEYLETAALTSLLYVAVCGTVIYELFYIHKSVAVVVVVVVFFTYNKTYFQDTVHTFGSLRHVNMFISSEEKSWRFIC